MSGMQPATGMQPPTADIHARGFGLAHGAILTELLRLFVTTGVLPSATVQAMLETVRDSFHQPNATDFQMVAFGRIQNILDNVFPPVP